jgi:hypothetical protein
VVHGRLRFLGRDSSPSVEADAREAVRVSSTDVGLFNETRTFLLWVEARRAPLALASIEPMLEALRERLAGISTGSTLVALILIDVLRISGHAAEARQLTDEIITFAISHGERAYLPELIRMRGELQEDPAAAGRDYREALELARSTGATNLERRAAASLAALG